MTTGEQQSDNLDLYPISGCRILTIEKAFWILCVEFGMKDSLLSNIIPKYETCLTMGTGVPPIVIGQWPFEHEEI
ncbi:hypothetical protein ABEB36_003806 [Hypothenemus hampei]|uniref:Uncharacterized protein n=1 Tax=Hypothenemus hampei TaxID=57062 RepID=A0ABD1F166_HYPHA